MGRMRVLVTGAAGFLGRHVVRRLIAEGYDVIAHGRTRKALSGFEADGVRVAAWDLQIGADAETLGGLGALDAIVHCAGLSSNWGPRAAFEAANIEATRLLLAQSRSCGAPHVIYVSSSSVYFDFRDQWQVREDHPLPSPVNDYAWSKRGAEEVVRGAQGLKWSIIRPRGIYGKGDAALLPRLIRAARRGPLPLFRDGATMIDLTHVEDVAASILAVLRASSKAYGKTYNVSGGEPIAIRQIIEQSAARFDLEVRWRPVSWPIARMAIRAIEQFHRVFRLSVEPVTTQYSAGLLAFNQTLNIEAIAEDTGWRPSIRFQQGLEKTFAASSPNVER